MVKLGLQISARLENLQKVEVCGEDFRYHIKTRCTNCGEMRGDKWQYVTLTESQEGRTGGRSECHMKAKCKGCGRELSLSILEDSVKPYVFNEDKPEEDFQTIVVFEGRGMEVVEFDFRVRVFLYELFIFNYLKINLIC
jgi:hypothetical protein